MLFFTLKCVNLFAVKYTVLTEMEILNDDTDVIDWFVYKLGI